MYSWTQIYTLILSHGKAHRNMSLSLHINLYVQVWFVFGRTSEVIKEIQLTIGF